MPINAINCNAEIVTTSINVSGNTTIPIILDIINATIQKQHTIYITITIATKSSIYIPLW